MLDCCLNHLFRFKPGEGFKECPLDASRDGLWWEDIAVDSNLEMWLVRAPVDVSNTNFSIKCSTFASVITKISKQTKAANKVH